MTETFEVFCTVLSMLCFFFLYLVGINVVVCNYSLLYLLTYDLTAE